LKISKHPGREKVADKLETQETFQKKQIKGNNKRKVKDKKLDQSGNFMAKYQTIKKE